LNFLKTAKEASFADLRHIKGKIMSLRAGVIGVGYLGRFHAQKYALLNETELIGVVDTDSRRAAAVAQECGTIAFADHNDLLEKVDMVSIAVPTHDHFSVAKDSLEAGCHVLIEKPITQTVEEANDLIEIAKAKKSVFQVGHLERFNPAILALEGVLKQPMFIESHRMAPFKPRGTDVNVVLDLMIHDIDIILNLVRSDVTHIHAVGVPVLSDEVDIANARLEFASGCVANVTASRVSLEGMRKIRLFQSDAYISIDYQNCNIAIFRKEAGGSSLPGLPDIGMKTETFDKRDALLDEIKAFIRSISDHDAPVVSAEDGRKALDTAIKINQSLVQAPPA
jgi:predicted dehydrogenase